MRFEAISLTGAAVGKIKLKGHVHLLHPEQKEIRNADIFIHLKGFSRARVTHLDIEHPKLEILPPGSGRFFTVHGICGGLEIKPSNRRNDQTLRIESPILNEIVKTDEKTYAWVGGKTGGFYIGFRKSKIIKLENLAQRLKPRR